MSDQSIDSLSDVHPVENTHKNRRDKKKGAGKEEMEQSESEHKDDSGFRDKEEQQPRQFESSEQDVDNGSSTQIKGHVLDIEV